MIEVRARTGRFAALTGGDGPTVLCLHGFPDTARTFEPLRPFLAGYRVVAPWLRGYVPSEPGGPHDQEQLAEDVVALADALSPDRPVFVVGHDWGALATYGALLRAPGRFAAAVTLAVPHPAAFLRNLVRQPAQLRRSWYIVFFQLPALPERAVRNGLIRRLWRAWSPGLSWPLDDVERCVIDSLPAPLDYYRAMGRALRAGRRFPPTPIGVPTLSLHGADDGCIGARLGDGQERFFAGDFRAEELRGAGHFLHLEDPARVAGLIVSWFGSHAPPAGR